VGNELKVTKLLVPCHIQEATSLSCTHGHPENEIACGSLKLKRFSKECFLWRRNPKVKTYGDFIDKSARG